MKIYHRDHFIREKNLKLSVAKTRRRVFDLRILDLNPNCALLGRMFSAHSSLAFSSVQSSIEQTYVNSFEDSARKALQCV